jgi:cytochrome P450
MRTCRAPFTVRDVTFDPGDLVLLSFASANRDEDVFVEPVRLDVRRENASPHLAFGFGQHYCLGAHLARTEIRTLFKELLGRLEFVELAGTPAFVHSSLVTGPKTLPIRYLLR